MFFRADLCFAALSKASSRLQKRVMFACSVFIQSLQGKKRKSVCEMEAALCQQFTWVCRIFSSSHFSGLRQNWFLNFHQMDKAWCYWCESLFLIPGWFCMVLAKKKKKVQFKCSVCSPFSLARYPDSVEGSWKMGRDFLVFPELWDPSLMAVQRLQCLQHVPKAPLPFPTTWFSHFWVKF